MWLVRHAIYRGESGILGQRFVRVAVLILPVFERRRVPEHAEHFLGRSMAGDGRPWLLYDRELLSLGDDLVDNSR
jgi:hypothetical protein